MGEHSADRRFPAPWSVLQSPSVLWLPVVRRPLGFGRYWGVRPAPAASSLAASVRSLAVSIARQYTPCGSW